MSDHFLYLTKGHKQALLPGRMTDHHFWLLVEISPLHSEKVINALRDFLVLGYTRKEACERHEVSQGYFSGALGRIQRTHQTVNRLVPFYISEAGIPYTGYQLHEIFIAFSTSASGGGRGLSRNCSENHIQC